MVDSEKIRDIVRSSRLGVLNDVFQGYDLREVRDILQGFVTEINKLLGDP